MKRKSLSISAQEIGFLIDAIERRLEYLIRKEYSSNWSKSDYNLYIKALISSLSKLHVNDAVYSKYEIVGLCSVINEAIQMQDKKGSEFSYSDEFLRGLLVKVR